VIRSNLNTFKLIVYKDTDLSNRSAAKTRRELDAKRQAAACEPATRCQEACASDANQHGISIA
jgi:hypothetical protein